MDVDAVRLLISGTELPDIAACRAELIAIRNVRGLVDAREVAVASRLDELADEQPTTSPSWARRCPTARRRANVSTRWRGQPRR